MQLVADGIKAQAIGISYWHHQMVLLGKEGQSRKDHEDGGQAHPATMGSLQGLGIATMLIGVCEQRVHARGLAFAALGVEDDNPRASRLYERLGYQAADRRHPAWEYEDDGGVLRLYKTTLTILRKRV